MNPPMARLWLAVHDEGGFWIELIPEIETERPERRLIAEPGTDVVSKISQVDR